MGLVDTTSDKANGDRIIPALAGAAGRVEHAGPATSGMSQEQAEAISGRVREQPMIALLVAAGVGRLTGRIVR